MFNGRYTFDSMSVAKDSYIFASEYAVFDWGISTIPRGNIQVRRQHASEHDVCAVACETPQGCAWDVQSHCNAIPCLAGTMNIYIACKLYIRATFCRPAGSEWLAMHATLSHAPHFTHAQWKPAAHAI